MVPVLMTSGVVGGVGRSSYRLEGDLGVRIRACISVGGADWSAGRGRSPRSWLIAMTMVGLIGGALAISRATETQWQAGTPSAGSASTPVRVAP